MTKYGTPALILADAAFARAEAATLAAQIKVQNANADLAQAEAKVASAVIAVQKADAELDHAKAEAMAIGRLHGATPALASAGVSASIARRASETATLSLIAAKDKARLAALELACAKSRESDARDAATQVARLEAERTTEDPGLNPRRIGGDVPDGLSGAYMTAKDLAEFVGQPLAATRKKLERFAKKHRDCRFKYDYARRGEGKWLYRVQEVIKVLS